MKILLNLTKLSEGYMSESIVHQLRNFQEFMNGLSTDKWEWQQGRSPENITQFKLRTQTPERDNSVDGSFK